MTRHSLNPLALIFGKTHQQRLHKRTIKIDRALKECELLRIDLEQQRISCVRQTKFLNTQAFVPEED